MLGIHCSSVNASKNESANLASIILIICIVAWCRIPPHSIANIPTYIGKQENTIWAMRQQQRRNAPIFIYMAIVWCNILNFNIFFLLWLKQTIELTGINVTVQTEGCIILQTISTPKHKKDVKEKHVPINTSNLFFFPPLKDERKGENSSTSHKQKMEREGKKK